MRKLLKNTAIPLLLIFSLSACDIFSSSNDKDDQTSSTFTDGIVNGVWDFISPQHLAVIEDDLDVPIYRGDNPPPLEDIFDASAGESLTFLMKPFILVSTTVPNDQNFELPRTFNDLYLRLSNQNVNEYTINMELTHPNNPPHVGTSGYIVGENNRFTIFGPLVQQSSGYERHLVHVLSGRIGNNAMVDLNLGILMIDNGGSPGAIPNNTGRRFVDQQGVSARSNWPHSGALTVNGEYFEGNKNSSDISGSIFGLTH